VIQMKHIKRLLKTKIKRIKLNLIIKTRVYLCNNIKTVNFADCANCSRSQMCHRKYLKGFKWII
jgi:hypothetical protein